VFSPIVGGKCPIIRAPFSVFTVCRDTRAAHDHGCGGRWRSGEGETQHWQRDKRGLQVSGLEPKSEGGNDQDGRARRICLVVRTLPEATLLAFVAAIY
jgi:hypothetical protein